MKRNDLWNDEMTLTLSTKSGWEMGPVFQSHWYLITWISDLGQIIHTAIRTDNSLIVNLFIEHSFWIRRLNLSFKTNFGFKNSHKSRGDHLGRFWVSFWKNVHGRSYVKWFWNTIKKCDHIMKFIKYRSKHIWSILNLKYKINQLKIIMGIKKINALYLSQKT